MLRKKLWVTLGVLLALALTSALPAGAAVGGPVSSLPVSWTPQLATSGTDGSVEVVRQLVPCGANMYAVGEFTQIKRGTTVYNRNNAFSFSATTGVVTSWDPNVNGMVNSVALSADCSVAYLGGLFTSVHGTTVKNITAVSTATGAVVPGFGSSAGGQVSALVRSGSHLLVGGYFPAINNSPRKYMASLNLTTGVDDGYVNLNISGNYVYVDQQGRPSKPNASRVYNFTMSPDGTKLLAMGVFTSVGGVGRRQIFMLDLGPTSATVNPWYSSEFDVNCMPVQPFWLQDASWSPDMTKIYIATTGYKPALGPAYYTFNPRSGLCDVTAAFPTTPGLVSNLWINHTGCDSLYSTAADANTVYLGGHHRWVDNTFACDRKGIGATDSPGMSGLDPTTGTIKPGFNPTKGRGLGSTDMLVTPAGLWIASDNQANVNQCGGVHGHSGICFLPY